MNIPIFSKYRLKATNETDYDLARLLSKSKTISFNQNEESGFSEVEIVPISEVIDPQYAYLLEECEKTYKDFDKLMVDLKDRLLLSLHNILLKTGPKLFCTSAGADSRIIAWLVKELENKYGTYLTDDIMFVCHHPEGDLFKAAMRKMGWPAEKYHVHKEHLPQSADYYSYGDFTLNMNSFAYPTINFWSDVIPRGEEKNWHIVSGSFSGELLHYPLYKPSGLLPNRYKLIEMWLGSCGLGNAYMSTLWKEVHIPYLDYKYLDVALRMDDSLYGYHKDDGDYLGIDKVRGAHLQNFGDDIPCNVGHIYELSISTELASYIQNCWDNSKFVRDFGDRFVTVEGTGERIKIRDAKPSYTMRGSFDSKLYSLATMYENVIR